MPRRLRELDAEQRVVLWLAAGSVAFGVWFSTFGADLRDDGHAVALAWRLSLGDSIFTDEMNVQALGSLAAVPFTWVWTQLFGMSGLVLASRIFFVAVSVAVGSWGYRALRAGLRPLSSFIGIAVPLLALPYNLPVLSYNTAPVLAMVLATAAAYAAVRTDSQRWAAVAGGSAAAAAVSNPSMTPGALLLLLVTVLVSRRRSVIGPVVLGGLLVAVVFVAWLLLVPGTAAVRETLTYTMEYQAQRPPARDRLGLLLQTYQENLFQRRYWPMWVLVGLAMLPGLSRRARALAVAGVPLAACLATVHVLLEPRRGLWFGKPIGTFAVVMCLALLLPVAIWVVRRRDHDVGLLLGLTLPIALVQAPVIGATTSSGPLWGVPVVGACTLVLSISVGWSELIARADLRWTALGVVSLVTAAMVMLVLRPFYEPFAWKLEARIPSGAYAGLSTTPAKAELFTAVGQSCQSWLAPGDTVLFYGSLPGGYLICEARPRSNILWLGAFGRANTQTLTYLEKAGAPDVVFLELRPAVRAGGWDELRRQDPLVEYVMRNYRTVQPDVAGAYRVLVRSSAPAHQDASR